MADQVFNIVIIQLTSRLTFDVKWNGLFNMCCSYSHLISVHN